MKGMSAMEIPKDKSETQTMDDEHNEAKMPMCTCNQDPFATLPPKLRPRQRSWMDDFRKVTCPECGFEYWTNRKTDLCAECEKKSMKLLEIKL